MKRLTNLLILILLSLIMISCYSPQKQALEKKQIAPKSEVPKLVEDSIYTDLKDIHNTPYIDVKAVFAYLRANNKYKDWDKNDPQKVLVGLVSEKDGSTSHVHIKKSCGIDKLDNEAIRLVKELKYEKPAKNSTGDPIRAGNLVIFIPFPSQ